MAKRLTEKQIEGIKQSFIDGKTVEYLSEHNQCTKLTIIRNLKKSLGEKYFKELMQLNKDQKQYESHQGNKEQILINDQKNIDKPNKDNNEIISFDTQNERDYSLSSSFLEITPLDCEIESANRQELSSIPITEIQLPEVAYMIVDKNIELDIKFLKDFPAWEFLPVEDLDRKTIEIFLDLKSAKRLCNKAQKVIKVPNTNVFRIVSAILIERGISRIVADDKLISL